MKDKVLFGIVAAIVIVVAIGAVTTFVIQVNNTSNELEEKALEPVVVEETAVPTLKEVTVTVNNADAVIGESISLEDFLKMIPDGKVEGLEHGNKYVENDYDENYHRVENWTQHWYWQCWWNNSLSEWDWRVGYQERISDDLIFQIIILYDNQIEQIKKVSFSQLTSSDDYGGRTIKVIPLHVTKNMLEGLKF